MEFQGGLSLLLPLVIEVFRYPTGAWVTAGLHLKRNVTAGELRMKADESHLGVSFRRRCAFQG
jgi:hypothetical protein